MIVGLFNGFLDIFTALKHHKPPGCASPLLGDVPMIFCKFREVVMAPTEAMRLCLLKETLHTHVSAK